MASTINAKTTGVGGIDASGDASGVLQLQTGGTAAVTVDASQNVGIGTATPNAIFQVNSTASLVRPAVTATTGYVDWQVSSSGGNFYFGIDNSAGSISGTAYARHIYSDGAYPIDFFTNSANRMRIDSSGRVTMPYQPAFSAMRTTAFNSGSSGYPVCSYDQYSGSANAFNTGSHFNGTTFTAPVAGTYLFQCHFIADTTNNLDFGIQANGGEQRNTAMVFNATTNKSGQITAILKLAANDTVRVAARGYGVSSVGSNIHTYFQGYLLG